MPSDENPGCLAALFPFLRKKAAPPATKSTEKTAPAPIPAPVKPSQTPEKAERSGSAGSSSPLVTEKAATVPSQQAKTTHASLVESQAAPSIKAESSHSSHPSTAVSERRRSSGVPDLIESRTNESSTTSNTAADPMATITKAAEPGSTSHTKQLAAPEAAAEPAPAPVTAPEPSFPTQPKFSADSRSSTTPVESSTDSGKKVMRFLSMKKSASTRRKTGTNAPAAISTSSSTEHTSPKIGSPKAPKSPASPRSHVGSDVIPEEEEAPTIVGRQWNKESDNDSLFCY